MCHSYLIALLVTDELIVIFNPEIVSKINCKPFTNPPDNFIEVNFEASSRVETVEKFCIRTASLTQRKKSDAFLEHLISNLTQSQVGLYSMMHEVSTIAQGYDHPESIRLAYMCVVFVELSEITVLNLSTQFCNPSGLKQDRQSTQTRRFPERHEEVLQVFD